jgi:hypothetical protein
MKRRIKLNAVQLDAFAWQPGMKAARDHALEWLRRIRSGRSLTLVEYVRAEEVLVASSAWQARSTVGALSLASEAPGSPSAAETALARELRNERLEL